MTDVLSVDRDRLIHILVVHYDMFRDKAEEAADLFLHDKTLSTPPVGAETGVPVATNETVYLRSYLAWAVAQIEVMNDDNELSVSEWAEDAAMFWQAKQMTLGNDIEHLLHDEDVAPASPDTVGEDWLTERNKNQPRSSL